MTVSHSPAESVRVDILGPLLLDTGNGPISVGGPRLRGLLARLALDAGRAVRPEVLIDALWADGPPIDESNTLQSLVSRLRRVLGDPGLLTSGPAGYRLAIEAEAVDAERFEQLARSGRQLLAEGRNTEAAATLREALALWRGPALADVRGTAFADAAAQRLDHARITVLENRIEADLDFGANLDLVGELESLTTDHPLRERPHAQLIRALAECGRGTEALAVYERVRGRLAEAFGSDPGPELQAAHLAVLRTEIPSPRRESRPHRSHGNLDAPLTSFVGRGNDICQVVALLGQNRLVTLVGPGGAGKTRLANTVGHELRPSGGVWFVALAPVTADDVPGAVLDVLRRPGANLPTRSPSPSRAEITDSLIHTLSTNDIVLVLDNCEHVIDAAATLTTTLLTRCPRLRVLTTSREPLRIDGEALHPVRPLDLPDFDATEQDAQGFSAIQLFYDRAGAVHPDIATNSVTTAVDICRRLDGLPLAIELAAARLRTLPIETIAARLDDRFRLLTRGSRTALPRHRTLRAVVDWSWQLLDTDERILIERLAVVPGSISESAAHAIGLHEAEPGDTADLLTTLADKSLLHPIGADEAGEPRYRMLETIREYGLEQLATRDEVDSTRARHARFLLDLAETADRHLRTADQMPWFAALSAERDNLRTAIRWSVDMKDIDTAVRFGAALSWFWNMRGNPPESLDLLARIVEASGQSEHAGRALVATAYALATEDIGPETLTDAEQSEQGDSHPLFALSRLATAITTPRPPTELPHFVGADEHDPWGRAFELLLRGLFAMNTGNLTTAADFLSRAAKDFEELGERWGIATALSSLGGVRRLSGDQRGALALNERGTRYFHELGLRDYSMENEVQAALIYARDGDADEGRRQIERLLARAESAESTAQARLGLAQLAWWAGQSKPAREHALAGLAAPSGETIPSHLTALLLSVLAQADTADGDVESALRRLDHPAVHVVTTRYTPIAATIAVVVAAIELCQNRPSDAARLLGIAAALRGADDDNDAEVQRITQGAKAILGGTRFTAEYSAGASMPPTAARELVSAVIAASGTSPDTEPQT